MKNTIRGVGKIEMYDAILEMAVCADQFWLYRQNDHAFPVDKVWHCIVKLTSPETGQVTIEVAAPYAVFAIAEAHLHFKRFLSLTPEANRNLALGEAVPQIKESS